MRHLGERITDYIFGELSPVEMAEVQSHLAQCVECTKEVELFQRTHSMLKVSADVNPPRSVVFEFDKPAVSRFWRWAMPVAAAAVLVLGIFLLAPIRIQSGNNQFAIIFGDGRPAEPSVPTAPPSVQAVVPASVTPQPVDYERIQAWIREELEKREANQVREIQRLQGQLAYLENLQQGVERETMANASSIQMLAQRGPSED